MRLRVWRRFRIARGVTANVGKSGLTSVSFGRRGMRYTLGRRRHRVTVGIPGSGIFLTEEAPLRRRRGVQQRAPAASGFIVGVLLVILAVAVLGNW